MGQQLQSWRPKDWRPKDWRSAAGQKLWLSMLVDTMEQISRPEVRRLPCSPSALIALRDQLARPASPYIHGASGFSWRN